MATVGIEGLISATTSTICILLIQWTFKSQRSPIHLCWQWQHINEIWLGHPSGWQQKV